MINAFQFSWPAGNHVFTLQSHDFFPFSGYPYTVTLCFQPSLNSDPGSALWFAPSRIVVYPIARAWLRGYPVVGIHFWPNWNNAILYFLREHFGRDNRNLATVVTTLSAIQYGR